MDNYRDIMASLLTLPMFSIPQSKRAKGPYEEAIAGFEKIAADYPDEVKPYICRNDF